MNFAHQFIDADPGYDGWGAVVIADFDGDGRPEFATGGKGGGIYRLFDYLPAQGVWRSETISDAYSPNVGAATLDTDGDGVPEIVCGEWGERLLHFTRRPEGWTCTIVGDNLNDPHDVLAGDMNGDGRDEVVVREKDGRLLVWHPTAAGPWRRQLIASDLPGDGTALAAIARPGVLDLVTNAGWFENVHGDGSAWVHHPLVPDHLDWHPESRLVVADLDGNGRPNVVLSESEIGPARLLLLSPEALDRPWRPQLLIDRDRPAYALHSLQVADLDGDGKTEIFTAEMENGKTDGIKTQPRWLALKRDAAGAWKTHVLLDNNLGTHSAVVGDFDGDGRLDLVGKVWRANAANANGGRNHIDFLRQV